MSIISAQNDHPTPLTADKNKDIAPTYFQVTSTANKATPHLAYVKIFLGALENENTQKTSVKALHDSGCAATIINRKIFEQIPDYKNIPVNATPNTFVVSVTGEQTAIYGSATIYVTFRGTNDINLTFPLDVHIHDDIEHDFILGRDFTGSDAKILETKDYLYLTHETDTSDPEDFWNRAKNLACHVPIISSPCKTYEVHSIETVLLPPLAMSSVPCKINRLQPIPTNIEPNTQIIFEVANLSQPRLKTFDSALYTCENLDTIFIPIFNNTNNEYLLESELPLADIIIWDENPTVYPINVTAMAHSILYETNNVHLSEANKINKDENLTEEEKLESFYEFLETGSYSMPMSSYVESRPTLTEMELKDIRPLSDEELQAQFKIDHLSPAHQRYATDLFNKYKAVFSRHEYDIGKAKDFEMDIEIDETKP